MMTHFHRLADRLAPFWQTWQARRPVLYVMPALGELWAAEVREGKFLRYVSVPLPDGSEEALAAAFQNLAEKLGTSSFVLLANFPSLRLSIKSFPAMPEDELVETLNWEQDRIFPDGNSLTMAWRVVSHSPEGYRVILYALPKELPEQWKQAAAAAGLTLTAALPTPDIPVDEEPHLALFERKSSAILLFSQGRRRESRILKRSEPGKLALFLTRLCSTTHLPDMKLHAFPLYGVNRDDMAAWEEWLLEELAAFAEANASTENAPQVRLAKSTMEEEPERDILTPLFLHAREACAVFPGGTRGETLSFRPTPLRIAQGVLLAAACVFLVSGIHFLSTQPALRQEQQRAASLAPVKAAFDEDTAARQQDEKLLADMKQRQQQDPDWGIRLITLSDSLPEGIVLKSIRTEGDTVHLTGTAQSGDSLSRFRQNLEQSWGGRVHVGKRKWNDTTHLQEFTMEWGRAADSK